MAPWLPTTMVLLVVRSVQCGARLSPPPKPFHGWACNRTAGTCALALGPNNCYELASECEHACSKPGTPSWYGPSTLIWNDACTLIGSAGKGPSVTPALCEAACTNTTGCNAINFDSDASATGDRCQLRRCPSPSRPTWSVPHWQGFATFPVPAPPAPPPSPPRMQLVLLEKAANTTGAACLDGSPPGFYYEEGTGTHALL